LPLSLSGIHIKQVEQVKYMKTIFLVSLFSISLNSYALAKTPGEVEVGAYLPEAKLQGFSNKSKKFSELRGKPLIINVWASWCGPCRAEMDSLERLSKRYNGKQINIIGISTDDDADAAAVFIKEARLTFDNYLDSHVVLENILGANTIPLTIFVDARGRVVQKVRGSHEWDSQESLKLISNAFQLKLK
jgi:thiol-disulfide isomerase/thioredoxin